MTFGVYRSRWSRQGSMMLKSEHDRRGGDDRIIANGGRQDEFDELTEASHKTSREVLLRQQVKRNTMEGDEDDQ